MRIWPLVFWPFGISFLKIYPVKIISPVGRVCIAYLQQTDNAQAGDLQQPFQLIDFFC